MANIIGTQKFKAKNEKVYARVYFTWADDSVSGLACDSAICSPEYLEKLLSAENLRVGYDKEKQSRFLYASKL
ncbi:MAG: hypothetical protein J6S49_09630 [Erysipelotrichaceae bacterium]|nr:hypothetical protein [Erysipelotrichaceae bacterium]